MNKSTEIPILTGKPHSGKDERFKDVYLLQFDEEVHEGEWVAEKTTAEYFDNRWVISDWEVTYRGDEPYWFCRSSFSISYDML